MDIRIPRLISFPFELLMNDHIQTESTSADICNFIGRTIRKQQIYQQTSMQSSMFPYKTDQMTPFSFIFDSFRYDKVPKLMEVQHKRCW